MQSSAPLQVWVSSRQRPAWNLPRLLMQDELLELGPDALAFSREEFDAMVALHAPATAGKVAEEIWQQTLGWCAGSKLLLSAHRRSAHAGLHWLRDYLEHELVSRMDEEQRDLLVGLAHLPRFSATLCAELWDELDGQKLFHELLQSQSFFQPLDQTGEWYCMLPAVANALRSGTVTPAIGRLRLNACRILEGLGFLDDAIELALSAGHLDVAANYIDRLRPNWLFERRNVQTLYGWRKQLPGELVEGTPNLIFLNASALMIGGRMDEALATLARLENFLPQPSAEQNQRLVAIWQSLYGSLQSFLGKCDVAREYCQAALEHLDSDDWQVCFLGYAALARMATADGDTLQAQHYLLEAVELARRQRCLASEVLINCERIGQMLLCGETQLAESLLEENLELLAADGNRHHLMLGRLLVVRGKLCLKRGEPDSAEVALRDALRHGQDHVGPFTLVALLNLSKVSASRGDYQQAFRYLQDAERRMQCANVTEAFYRGVLNLQSLTVLVSQGDWEQAASLARMLEDYLRGSNARSTTINSPSLPQRNQLLLARAEQQLGRVKEAERRLQTLEKDCQRLNYLRLQNETRQTLKGFGDETQPQPGRVSPQQETPFGKPFSLPIRAARPSLGQTSHENRPVGSLRKGEELTARELSILELMAEGLSNPEISERLYISTNTVKAHTKNINNKLGVVRRTQAIVRARALGVLA
ncbi:HTH-type transcriptional regulator MalT [compost metagenome]